MGHKDHERVLKRLNIFLTLQEYFSQAFQDRNWGPSTLWTILSQYSAGRAQTIVLRSKLKFQDVIRSAFLSISGWINRLILQEEFFTNTSPVKSILDTVQTPYFGREQNKQRRQQCLMALSNKNLSEICPCHSSQYMWHWFCSVWMWEKILPWPQTYAISSFQQLKRLDLKQHNSQRLFQYLALTYSFSCLSIDLLSHWSILSRNKALKWNNFHPGQMREHRKMTFQWVLDIYFDLWEYVLLYSTSFKVG